MAVSDRFSDAELAAIRAATEAAEARTGAELVCVIVERCDSYEAPIWKAAAIGAVAGALAAGLWHTLLEVWGPPLLSWILLPPVLGAAVGLLLILTLPAVLRALIPQQVLERRVDRRAALAFLDEEIFDTRDRTGVLLFVALFERQIRILRDRGVEERVPAAAWDPIAESLSRSLRADQKGAALVEAIEACGGLLMEHGVARRPDDVDELADEPRLYDE